MNELRCIFCQACLPESAVRADGSVRCGNCHSGFELFQTTQPSRVRTVEEVLAYKPWNITVRLEPRFRVEVRDRRSYAWLVLLWPIAFGAEYMVHPDLLTALVFVACLAYAGWVLFPPVPSWVFEIEQDELRVLPKGDRMRRHKIRELRQLSVFITWVTGKKKADSSYQYLLRADKATSSPEIARFHQRKNALYVEDLLEAYLGIVDRPVSFQEKDERPEPAPLEG